MAVFGGYQPIGGTHFPLPMIMGGRVPFDDAKTSFEKKSIPETLRYEAGFKWLKIDVPGS